MQAPASTFVGAMLHGHGGTGDGAECLTVAVGKRRDAVRPIALLLRLQGRGRSGVSGARNVDG